MQMAIIGFALGCAWLQQQGSLPEQARLTGALLVGGLLLAPCVASKARRGWFAKTLIVLSLMAGVALGAGWAGLRAAQRLGDELPLSQEGRDLVVTGVVDELPQLLEGGVRFAFRVESASGPTPSRILLGWYAPRGVVPPEPAPSVHAGERWRFTVRLKRPHGTINPGGFDMEAWLLERNLRATGYVRPANSHYLGQVWSPRIWIENLREQARSRIHQDLQYGLAAGILTALAVGDQRAIDPHLWQVFNRTGVQHLMAISGLHVGMVGLLTGWLVGTLWRRVPALALSLATGKAALLAGLLGAGVYGLIAGLGIPTQRTLLMLAVVVAGQLAGRRVGLSRSLVLALGAVLVMDPWAVIAAGFWLSFGAVAVLLLAGSGRFVADGAGKGFLRSQLAVSIGLLPLLLALFQQFSLVSPLANLLAIPLVGWVITPLVLVFLVCPFPPLLQLAAWLCEGLLTGLVWLAGVPLAVWQQAAAPLGLIVLALAGAAGLLLPRGTPGRWAGLVPLGALLAWSPHRPEPGAWWMTVLDVGQGLAVHVQTARHDLLFDTGPTWSPEANSGQRIVLPYLRGAGVGRLDRMVVSHDDSDHSGGAASILAGVPVVDLMSSLPDKHPLTQTRTPHRPCQAGDRWTWDGVSFAVLHPVPGAPSEGADNSRSCVIRIASEEGSALLMGDLEAPQEGELVARLGAELASDVLVAPHHGSNSSSSPGLVMAVSPREVIYPVGYRNAFRHPHPKVVARWEEIGAQSWRTDQDGAVKVEFQRAALDLTARRQSHPRYWHGR